MADRQTPASAAPRITVRENGAYMVSGGVRVTRKRMLQSEHGEPITWQLMSEVDAPPAFALCRCGGSANKPFCDGTHETNGFDGTETAPFTSYRERQKTYVGTGIVVRDDRSLCEHAGFCGNRSTNIWSMVSGTDTEDSIARAQAMAMVERCPSGALTYGLESDGPDVEPELRPGIGVVEDGPLFVTGAIPVVSSEGAAREVRSRQTLCRCGWSANKPFCDGTHQKIGFHDG
ncbi:MAG: CDGSH iron-sulfur domain-containing protein [Acidimicrobiales bacterium]